MIIFVGRGQRRKFIIYEDFMAKKVKTGKFFAKHKLYLYNKAHSMFVCLFVCLFVCPGLPWPYLLTAFGTNGIYGLLIIQG